MGRSYEEKQTELLLELKSCLDNVDMRRSYEENQKEILLAYEKLREVLQVAISESQDLLNKVKSEKLEKELVELSASIKSALARTEAEIGIIQYRLETVKKDSNTCKDCNGTGKIRTQEGYERSEDGIIEPRVKYLECSTCKGSGKVIRAN